MRSGRQSRRWLWMLIASAVLCQIALNLARPLISYKVLALGGDSVAVGLTSASFALLPVAIALWLGRMSDRRSSMRGITVAGTLLLTAGPFLLSAAPSLLLVGVASAVLGIGHLCFTIAGQSAIARFVPLSRMDAASAGSSRRSRWASSWVRSWLAWPWDLQETHPPTPGSWTPTQH